MPHLTRLVAVLIPLFLKLTGVTGLTIFLSVLQLIGTREISRLPRFNESPLPTSILFKMSQVSAYGVAFSQTMLKLLSKHHNWSLQIPLLTLTLISTTLLPLVIHLNTLPTLTPPLISAHLSTLTSLLISSSLILIPTTLALDLVLSHGGSGWSLLIYAVMLGEKLIVAESRRESKSPHRTLVRSALRSVGLLQRKRRQPPYSAPRAPESKLRRGGSPHFEERRVGSSLVSGTINRRNIAGTLLNRPFRINRFV